MYSPLTIVYTPRAVVSLSFISCQVAVPAVPVDSKQQYSRAVSALPGISLTVILDKNLIETGLLTAIENKEVYVGMALRD